MDSNQFACSLHITAQRAKAAGTSHHIQTNQWRERRALGTTARLASLTALALALSLPAVVAQAASTVTLGCDPVAQLKGMVSYYNLSSGGGKEVSVGESPSNVSSGDVTWGTSKNITFTYNGIGNLSTTVPGSTPSPVARSVPHLGQLNYLQITITKNQAPTTINLNNVTLGSDSLANFAKPANTQGSTCWSVTGVDMTGGFTLSGELALSGPFGGGSSSNLQIDIGYLAPQDEEVVPTDEAGPVTSGVGVLPDPVYLNGTATVSATVDDTTTGGSSIVSAEYNLNSGSWLAMSTKDGAYDEVTEEVEVSFDATEIGSNSVCVRGTDLAGNTGDALCQTFMVTYKFDGFFSPVDNGMVNVAKAGQAIPIKWRLTDANNVPIAYSSSFSGMYSSENLCVGGLPTDAVEESTAGSSGLQYNGDGYWQFNWKTPKDYANKCRVLYMQYNSGATSPVVRFEFKK